MVGLVFTLIITLSTEKLKADRGPPPRIEEIFADLNGNYIFRTPDFFAGYWQILMAEECKEMTLFVIHFGKFEVMPFW